MKRLTVVSSNILSIGHDHNQDVLEVEFKGGKVFHYGDVTLDEYAALINSDSVGSHFSRNIKKCKDVIKDYPECATRINDPKAIASLQYLKLKGFSGDIDTLLALINE